MQIDHVNILTASAFFGAVLFSVCASLTRRRPITTIAIVASLLVALAALATSVARHGILTGLDAAAASRIGRPTDPSHLLDVMCSVIDKACGPTATVVIGVAVGTLLSWQARSAIPALVVLGTVGAAALAKTCLKAIVYRPVSEAELTLTPHGYHSTLHPGALDVIIIQHHSFPSGHVTATGVLLGMIAVCAGAGRSRVFQRFLAFVVSICVVIIALTQLYIGAHWLSDVLGGVLLTGLFVTLGSALMNTFKTRPRGAVGETAACLT